MRIQTVGYQPWSADELRSWCGTNRALSQVSTAHLALYESYGKPRVPRGRRELSWAILIESIYSFDLNKGCTVPRFCESWHHVRLHAVPEARRLRVSPWNSHPRSHHRWWRRRFGMDIFASGENVADMVMSADEEHRLRERPVWALGRLSPDQRDHYAVSTVSAKAWYRLVKNWTVVAKPSNGANERAIWKPRRYLGIGLTWHALTSYYNLISFISHILYIFLLILDWRIYIKYAVLTLNRENNDTHQGIFNFYKTVKSL